MGDWCCNKDVSMIRFRNSSGYASVSWFFELCFWSWLDCLNKDSGSGFWEMLLSQWVNGLKLLFNFIFIFLWLTEIKFVLS